MLYGINGTFRSKTLCRIDHEKKIVFFIIHVGACSIVRILWNTMEDSLVAQHFLF